VYMCVLNCIALSCCHYGVIKQNNNIIINRERPITAVPSEGLNHVNTDSNCEVLTIDGRSCA